MEPWIRAHLLTEHPWDLALQLEAMTLRIEADYRAFGEKLFGDDFDMVRWKVMFGYGAPLTFSKISVLDV